MKKSNVILVIILMLTGLIYGEDSLTMSKVLNGSLLVGTRMLYFNSGECTDTSDGVYYLVDKYNIKYNNDIIIVIHQGFIGGNGCMSYIGCATTNKKGEAIIRLAKGPFFKSCLKYDISIKEPIKLSCSRVTFYSWLSENYETVEFIIINHIPLIKK